MILNKLHRLNLISHAKIIKIIQGKSNWSPFNAFIGIFPTRTETTYKTFL